jgi:hypothetical protein
MNGLQKTDGMKLQDGSTGWVPVSFADSTGDGWDDILFRHTSGALIHWGMRGLAQQSSAALLDPGAGWSLVARGDFDGDGRSDILFQHADGTLIAWTMNGATKTGGFVVGQMAAGWRVIWIGDFNRDGKEDILIANDQTGSAKIYFTNGSAVSGTAQLDAGAGWQIGAIGNFDGTGNLSVVWRQNDGFSILWPLRSGVKNGGYVIQQPASGAMPIMQRADFDGDGIDDILWEYPNGDREITLLNASGIKTKAKALTSPNDYSAAVLKDFDGDGKTDIVWANPSGSVILWTMDGSSQTGGALLASGSAFLPKAFGPIVQ